MSRESDLRERVKEQHRRPPRRKQWRPVAQEEMLPATVVLGLDQSLTSTGWVLMQVLHGIVQVHAKGTVKTPRIDGRGHALTLARGHALRRELEALDRRLAKDPDLPRPRVVVAEQTPVMGYRLESSLLAGFVVGEIWPDVAYVANNTASAMFLPPDQRAEKKHTKALVPDRLTIGHGRWNEHERDALMLAMARLHLLRKELWP